MPASPPCALPPCTQHATTYQVIPGAETRLTVILVLIVLVLAWWLMSVQADRMRDDDSA